MSITPTQSKEKLDLTSEAFTSMWYHIISFIKLYSCNWSNLLFSLICRNILGILETQSKSYRLIYAYVCMCLCVCVCMRVYVCVLWVCITKVGDFHFLVCWELYLGLWLPTWKGNFFYSSTMTSFNKYLVNRSIFLLEKKDVILHLFSFKIFLEEKIFWLVISIFTKSGP